MEQEENNLRSVFRKIFGGTANPGDKERVARWLSRLDISERKPSFDEVEEQRLRFQKVFHDRYVATPSGRGIIRHLWWYSAAAVLLISLAVYLIIPREVSYQEFVTQAGERKNITLPDGTAIVLNNASKLKFPETFTGATREVQLEGEAYFQVSHNKEKPFIVRTAKLNVRVLGTSFDVSSYAAEDEIEVTVETGRVGVEISGKSTGWLLTPGQQLSYSNKTDAVRRSEVDTQVYTGWQSGEMVFENEPLDVICRRLERWYDVKITISTLSLVPRKISMEQKDESLQSVMKMLSIACDFHYKIDGKSVRIW